MEDKSDTYVIILAGGMATRLKPLSEKIPKPLIDINGKPLISRIIQSFVAANFNQFVILVGHGKEKIQEIVQKEEVKSLYLVDQPEQIGMADALQLCLNFLVQKGLSFKNVFVTASDVIFYEEKLIKMFNLLEKFNADMVLSLMRSFDEKIARGHGNVAISNIHEMNFENFDSLRLKISDIIEKPEPSEILSEYYSIPLYIFNKKILGYLDKVGFSKRGEKELQEAIMMAIKNQDKVIGLNIIGRLITKDNIGEYHLTFLEDIIKMNIRFLKESQITDAFGFSNGIFEPVFRDPSVKVGNSVKIGPNVVIHENCHLGDFSEISNSVIYKNTSIGESCSLDWCLVDSNISLPERFKASNCYISLDPKGEIVSIPF